MAEQRWGLDDQQQIELLKQWSKDLYGLEVTAAGEHRDQVSIDGVDDLFSIWEAFVWIRGYAAGRATAAAEQPDLPPLGGGQEGEG